MRERDAILKCDGSRCAAPVGTSFSFLFLTHDNVLTMSSHDLAPHCYVDTSSCVMSLTFLFFSYPNRQVSLLGVLIVLVLTVFKLVKN